MKSSYRALPGILTLFAFFLISSVDAQKDPTPILDCGGGPCDAIRWTDGASWNPDGTIDDTPNAGPPNGIIRCGNSANTQSNIGPNTCYDSSILTIPAGWCIDPSTGDGIFLEPPVEGEAVAWLNFDVRALAGSYEFQIVNGSDNIGWALFYSNAPTAGLGVDGLSGDCSDLTFTGCGVNFNGWADQPFDVPNLLNPTNYYLAIWDRDDESFAFNFKARFGCGDSNLKVCDLVLDNVETVCNGDGTYTASISVIGVNGEFYATDANALSISGPFCLGNLGEGGDLSATFDLVYNEGTGYDVTIAEQSPSTIGGCADPINSELCVTTVSGSPPDCCGLEVTCPPENGGSFQCLDDIPAGAESDVTVTGSCGPITITIADVTTGSGCVVDPYILTRTYTISDGQSTETCEVVYTAADTLAPVPPKAVEDANVQCADDVPPAVDLTATDNCDGEITVSPTENITPGLCPNDFVILRTWNFIDGCGNMSSLTQTVTVHDDMAPVPPAAPADITLQCADDVPTHVELYAQDNCDGEILGDIEGVVTPGLCENDFVVVCTWTFTDGCGNSSSVSQTITVHDDQAPVPPAAPADVNVQCADDVPPPVDLTAADNCDGDITVSPSGQITPGLCVNDFVMVRTWTFTDVCGNTSSVSQTITVLDDLAPVPPAAPADVNVQCADDVPPPVDLTAADNCDGDITVSPSGQITPGLCVNDFVMVRTWTFTDVCGNTSSVSQTITVLDDLAPVPPAAPADVNVQCADDVPPPVDLTAADNCDGDITVSPSGQITPGLCVNDFVMVRTWTFTDVCGNTSSVSQTITVLDDTPPVLFGIPADISLSCNEPVPDAIVVATDNCDEDLIVTLVAVTTTESCGSILTRTWSTMDACGNSVSDTQIVTITDNVAPTPPAAPADVTAQCAGDVPAPVELVATDECNGSIPALPVDDVTPGLCVNDFVIVRTWTFTNSCGNSSSVSQTITVLDDLAPVPPAAPADVNVQCADDVPPPVDLTAADNCDGDITVSPSGQITPGLCVNDFVMVRTWTFTDVCGNTSSVSQTITVLDDLAPVPPAAPADVNVQCADDVPPPVDLTAADNCDGDITVSPSGQITPGLCVNDFVMVRTWTFTDVCGNTSSVSQTITVLDDLAPVPPAAPADVNVQCADDVPPPVDLTAADNCDGDITVSPSGQITPGLCVNDFVMVRTWTFTDVCGNTSSVSQTITVLDDTPPVLFGVPDDLTIECDEPVSDAIVFATDNCSDGLIVTLDAVTTPLDCGELLTRTWSTVDECGNTASETQVITITDITPPVITGPEDPYYFLEWGVLGYNVIDAFINGEITEEELSFLFPEYLDLLIAQGFFFPYAEDNCSEEVPTVLNQIVIGSEDLECPVVGRIIWEFTATDDCDNVSDVFTVICDFLDTTPPELIGVPGDMVLDCGDDVPPPADVTAVDSCDENPTLDFTTVTTDVECLIVITRTWTATDLCGNDVTDSQTITISDSTPPVLSDLPEDLVLDCEDEIPSAPVLTATDDCDPLVEVVFEQTFIGDAPDPDADQDCLLLQAEGPYFDPDWALILPGFPLGYEYFTLVENGQWLEYDDGTAHITATVVSVDNPNGGFYIDIWLQDGMNWDDWSNQDFPTSYKDDWGIAGDNYLDWFYYIVNENVSYMTGWGDFEGSYIDVDHAPDNHYYGFQVGIAANNVNEAYGVGGWIEYSGTFVDSSNDYEGPVFGMGDVAFDLDCCPQYEIVWTWTATDCAGNETIHSMNVSFDDLPDGPEPPATGCAGDFNNDGNINTADLLSFLGDFGCVVGTCNGDMNGDGQTNTSDLLMFLGVIGTSCE